LSDPSFSNGAAYADLDNDVDLDLVVNNIDDKAFLYKNTTRENNLGNYLKVRLESENPHAFAKVTAYSDGTVQRKESLSVRGYLSAMDPSVHFGLGEGEIVDSLVVNWLSGNVEKLYDVSANQEISLTESKARKAINDDGKSIKQVQMTSTDSRGINFKHRENVFDDFEIETLLPYKQSKLGPHISVSDVNNDGLEDFFIGGAIGQSGQLFVQTTDKTFFDATSDEMRVDFLYEDMESVFMDVDNDGDQDLYVVSGGYEFEAGAAGYEDRLYLNTGFGKYQKAIDTTLSTNR